MAISLTGSGTCSGNPYRSQEYPIFHDCSKIESATSQVVIRAGKYDFVLVHRPGYMMGGADALSRRPDYEKGRDDNDGVWLIEPHHLRRIHVEDEGMDLL